MTARELVMDRVAGRVRHFPDLDTRPMPTTGLDARDAALALAIDQAVTRRWRTLEAAVEPHLRRPWAGLHPTVRSAMLVGAAQMLFLSRLPDHAVIDAAVEWTKRCTPPAAGMVNAVLRRVSEMRDSIVDHHEVGRRDEIALSDGTAWRLHREIMPAEPALQLAVQTSLAPALVERWIALVGFDAARGRAFHTLVMPPIIVVGVDGRTDPRLEPHEAPGAAVYIGPSGELAEVLAALPGTRVQDPSSAMAVSITASLKPRCIIDVCAGRGTKTRQLAALHPDARIIATDVDPARHEVLSHVFEGHPRVQVVPFDQLRSFDAQAELLVLDVPCSNTGVLARRLEARHRFSEKSLEALLRLQRQIAADTWPLLADRAVVLYATCSIDPEENERQAAWLVKHHRMRLLEETFVEPSGGPGGPASGYRDGAYAAMLEKA